MEGDGGFASIEIETEVSTLGKSDAVLLSCNTSMGVSRLTGFDTLAEASSCGFSDAAPRPVYLFSILHVPDSDALASSAAAIS